MTVTLSRFAAGWLVLVDGQVIGKAIPLTRGHGWRAGLVGERATGRYRTRLLAADALVARHARPSCPDVREAHRAVSQ